MSREGHICGNPSFDMFTCLGCHPELRPTEPPVRRDPFEEAIACASRSYDSSYDGPVTLSSIWISMSLKQDEFDEFAAWVKGRKAA